MTRLELAPMWGELKNDSPQRRRISAVKNANSHTFESNIFSEYLKARYNMFSFRKEHFSHKIVPINRSASSDRRWYL